MLVFFDELSPPPLRCRFRRCLRRLIAPPSATIASRRHAAIQAPCRRHDFRRRRIRHAATPALPLLSLRADAPDSCHAFADIFRLAAIFMPLPPLPLHFRHTLRTAITRHCAAAPFSLSLFASFHDCRFHATLSFAANIFTLLPLATHYHIIFAIDISHFRWLAYAAITIALRFRH